MTMLHFKTLLRKKLKSQSKQRQAIKPTLVVPTEMNEHLCVAFRYISLSLHATRVLEFVYICSNFGLQIARKCCIAHAGRQSLRLESMDVHNRMLMYFERYKYDARRCWFYLKTPQKNVVSIHNRHSGFSLL